MISSGPVFTLVASLALANLPGLAQAAESAGRWSVDLITESGPCNAHYSYAVAIEAGQVRLVSGGAGAQVSGRVGSDGRVGLTVSNGAASGTGTGRLAGRSGAGKWTVASLCSGRWTARRSGALTAQAE